MIKELVKSIVFVHPGLGAYNNSDFKTCCISAFVVEDYIEYGNYYDRVMFSYVSNKGQFITLLHNPDDVFYDINKMVIKI